MLAQMPAEIAGCPTSRYFTPGAQHILAHIANIHGHGGDSASKEVFENSQQCVRAVLLELINQWGVRHVFDESYILPEMFINWLKKGNITKNPPVQLPMYFMDGFMNDKLPWWFQTVNFLHNYWISCFETILMELVDINQKSMTLCEFKRQTGLVILPTQSARLLLAPYLEPDSPVHHSLLYKRERLSLAIAAAFSTHPKLNSQLILPMTYGGGHDFFGAVDDHNYYYHEYAPIFSLITIDAMANYPGKTSPHRRPPSARR